MVKSISSGFWAASSSSCEYPRGDLNSFSGFFSAGSVFSVSFNSGFAAGFVVFSAVLGAAFLALAFFASSSAKCLSITF